MHFPRQNAQLEARSFKASNSSNLINLSNLARCFRWPVGIAKPQAAKLMFTHHVFIKILGFRPKGTSFIFKNIEKLPKGPSFREGDRFFIGVRGVGTGDSERPRRVPVAMSREPVKGAREVLPSRDDSAI
jgi:hypothetical protein